jgi:hypothetical protein
MEHYMKTLKGYVQNKARPEGSMVEVYAIKEALGFYTEYLHDFTTTKQKVWDDKKKPCMYDEVFECNGHTRVLTTNF